MMFKHKYFRLILSFILFTLLGIQVQAQQMPEPADLLEFEDPRSLTLSPDGKQVILKTRRAVVDSNNYITSIWKIPTNNGRSSKLDLPKGTHSLEWFPDSRRIAYLAPSEKGSQIWVKEIGSENARQVTEQQRGIRDFSLSPDGQKVAYTTVSGTDQSKKKKSKGSWQGIEIDQTFFLSDQLLTDQLTRNTGHRPPVELRIAELSNGNSYKVSDTLSVEEFRWSPSGNKIALTAKPSSLMEKAPRTFRSDLYLFNTKSHSINRLFKGSYGGKNLTRPMISYSSPFWSPSGKRLGFERTDHSDVWSAVAEVGIINLKNGDHQYVTSADEQEFSASRYSWINKKEIYVEFTNRVKRGLFTLSVPAGKLTTVYNPDQHTAGFSFSRNGQKVVWVEESMGYPPEIYFSEDSFDSPQKITSLNDNYKDIWLPDVQYIQWTSEDGTKVNGWLMEAKESSDREPSPLLTHVHGGPGATATNTFHPNRAKKYPLQIFAARGYSVFISNYRGTNSFGKEFQEPKAIDDEPVEDIITGIEHLISKGVADEDRLGILGHSHGGWLAPMVAAEYPHFRAASVSEGFANFLSLYGQMPGWLNLITHEQQMSSTNPYENPNRYLEISPAFRDSFTKTTPSLLEYGQEKLAIQGLEMGKAFWRHNTPYKLVIYPDTGHNIFEPQKNVESMKRNLQWFEQWIDN